MRRSMKKRMRKATSMLAAGAMVMSAFAGTTVLGAESTGADADADKYSVEYMEADDFYRVTNPNGGTTLSYRNIELLEVEDGGYTYAFKDLNKNGELDPYEDWRLTYEERAADLAGKLELENIAGLMLFSAHTRPDEGGKVTDDQYDFIINDGVRAVLYAGSVEFQDAIKWSNEMQAIVEENDPFAIPVNISSDPRNGVQGSVEEDIASTTIGSGWPSNLGLAATFNPDYAKLMGEVIGKEYRALGIGTALSPQIDLATEPRWSRFSGTYGEDADLAADIASSIVAGMQSTWTDDGEDLGWGKDSIIAMVKHFPGDGAGEAGREAHNNYGKYAVYPGDNMAEHIAVFAATMDLGDKSKTEMAMAVMPSYSVAHNSQGNPIGEDVASGYSAYKLQDLLRGELGFKGVICSDWGITSGKAWGVERKSEVERHYLAIMNGLDMFGGNNSAGPIIQAYAAGSALNVQEEKTDREGNVTQEAVPDGSVVMDEAFFQIAYRVLYNEFILGLFDDAFLVTEESVTTLTDADNAAAGYKAQQESVIMLKNDNNLISEDIGEMKTVYIPMQIPENSSNAATQAAEQEADGAETLKAHILGDWSKVGYEDMSFDGGVEYAFDLKLASEYFNVVTDELRPETDLNNITEEDIIRRTDFTDVDFALVKLNAPKNGVGYVAEAVNLDPSAGEIDNGYYPISLTFGSYTADPEVVREYPLAVDPDEELAWQEAGGEVGKSRYYGGKTNEGNTKDLDLMMEVKENIGDLPIAVYVSATNPFCCYEFEPSADAIVVGLGVSSNAVLDILAGRVEPKGLLPMQLPLDMATVERQMEDVGRDMECHVDTNGNSYDFAYGLNWSGVIDDERVAAYK